MAILLLARLLLGVAYSVANPLGEAPDEADHYAYAAYIGREGRLPEGPELTQSKHPPLYHLLAAAVAAGLGADMDFGFLRSNPDVGLGPDALAPNFFVHTSLEDWPWRGGALAMHLGRLVAVAAGTLLAAATYALGRAVWPGWRSGPLAAAAFVAFLPEALFIGGAISNDILAAMWVTIGLWLSVRARRLPAALGAGLALGLAILTKASTAALVPVAGAAIFAVGLQIQPSAKPGATHWQSALHLPSVGRVAAAMLAAFLVAAPWLWRNLRLYGDPLGMPLVLATIDRRQGPLTLADLAWLARGWFPSFWGKFGGAGQLALPAPFYVVWALLVLLAVGGWLRITLSGRLRPLRSAPDGRTLRSAPTMRRAATPYGTMSVAAWIVLLGAPLMAALAIVSYSRVALGTDQGRLLFPAIAPIALLLAAGMAAWLPANRQHLLAPGLAAVMASVAVLALVLGIIVPFAPPQAPTPAEVAGATASGARFGDSVELSAFRWVRAGSPGPYPMGGHSGPPLPELTLYWRALIPIRQDLRVRLQLTDSAGNLLWESKRSPGAGRFSTDHWPANRLMRDVYRIPPESLAGAARVAISLRPFPEGDALAVDGRAGDEFLMLPIGGP